MAEVDWQAKALEYATKLKELVSVIKEEREANSKVKFSKFLKFFSFVLYQKRL